MELGTIFTIILWTFGIALAAPFVMLGLVVVGGAICAAVWVIVMAVGVVYWIGLGIYNLVGWPLGFGYFHEAKDTLEDLGEISSLSVEELEKGASPGDHGYVNCDEWLDWVRKVEAGTVGEN